MNTRIADDAAARLAAVQQDLSPREAAIVADLVELAKYDLGGERVEFGQVSLVSSYLKTYTDIFDNVLAANEGAIKADYVPKMIKEYPGRPFIPFGTERVGIKADFQDVILKRASQRDFVRQPVPLAEIATLLETAYGIKGRSNAYGVPNFPMRNAPNAGGLQSVEVYVIAFDVAGVEPGVYYYDGDRAGLVQLDRGLMRRRVHQICLFLQEWISEAGAVMILTCNVDKLIWKYGKKAYRMTHMDAGVLGDHLHLVSSAMGLGSCLVSGMFDQEAARLLGVDGQSEFPTLAVCVGKMNRA